MSAAQLHVYCAVLVEAWRTGGVLLVRDPASHRWKLPGCIVRAGTPIADAARAALRAQASLRAELGGLPHLIEDLEGSEHRLTVLVRANALADLPVPRSCEPGASFHDKAELIDLARAARLDRPTLRLLRSFDRLPGFAEATCVLAAIDRVPA